MQAAQSPLWVHIGLLYLKPCQPTVQRLTAHVSAHQGLREVQQTGEFFTLLDALQMIPRDKPLSLRLRQLMSSTAPVPALDKRGLEGELWDREERVPGQRNIGLEAGAPGGLEEAAAEAGRDDEQVENSPELGRDEAMESQDEDRSSSDSDQQELTQYLDMLLHDSEHLFPGVVPAEFPNEEVIVEEQPDFAVGT